MAVLKPNLEQVHRERAAQPDAPAAPVPEQAVTAAHAAVYAIVDNAMADIAADLGAMRGINTKTVRLHMRLAADTALGAAAPSIREPLEEQIANLRNALREAGAEMDRRYEMGREAERDRISQLSFNDLTAANIRIVNLEAALGRFEHLEEAAQAKAAGHAVEAERQRIRQLATERGATYPGTDGTHDGVPVPRALPFAGLIGDGPPGIIRSEGQLAQEQVEELKAKWLAAWEAGRGRPLEVLPDRDLEDRVAELEQELDTINGILRENGYEYPLGARGVSDMADHRAQQLIELVHLDPEHWAAPGNAAGPYGKRLAGLEQRLGSAEALTIQAQDYANAETERASHALALASAILGKHYDWLDHPEIYQAQLDEYGAAIDQLEDGQGEPGQGGQRVAGLEQLARTSG